MVNSIGKVFGCNVWYFQFALIRLRRVLLRDGTFGLFLCKQGLQSCDDVNLRELKQLSLLQREDGLLCRVRAEKVRVGC